MNCRYLHDGGDNSNSQVSQIAFASEEFSPVNQKPENNFYQEYKGDKSFREVNKLFSLMSHRSTAKCLGNDAIGYDNNPKRLCFLI